MEGNYELLWQIFKELKGSYEKTLEMSSPEIIDTVELRPDSKTTIKIGRLSKTLEYRFGVDEVVVHRADPKKCVYYDHCLTYATQNKFASFSCLPCPLFEESRYAKLRLE